MLAILPGPRPRAGGEHQVTRLRMSSRVPVGGFAGVHVRHMVWVRCDLGHEGLGGSTRPTWQRPMVCTLAVASSATSELWRVWVGANYGRVCGEVGGTSGRESARCKLRPRVRRSWGPGPSAEFSGGDLSTGRAGCAGRWVRGWQRPLHRRHQWPNPSKRRDRGCGRSGWAASGGGRR